MDTPAAIQALNLSGQNLSRVVCEDLTLFKNLSSLILNENKMALFPLGCLPAIRELSLQENQIKSIDINAAFCFPFLHVLDLSFNPLSQESILTLATIPNLNQLSLSNCSLSALPSQLNNMNEWWERIEHSEANDTVSIIPGFLKLVKLDLSGNLFESVDDLFDALSSLPR